MDNQAMGLSMGRLEGKIDQIHDAQVFHKETTDDHEVRIRLLEKGAWRRFGVVGTLSAMGGAFLTLLAKYGVTAP